MSVDFVEKRGSETLATASSEAVAAPVGEMFDIGGNAAVMPPAWLPDCSRAGRLLADDLLLPAAEGVAAALPVMPLDASRLVRISRTALHLTSPAQ